MTIGLFYGTETGSTEAAAKAIQQALSSELVTLHPIYNAEASDFEQYKYIIVGCPTWNIGELSSDWQSFF